ncbi:uncharacterized protein LOC131151514 [Malania oleifera]|uniref:uncharacterized protein LOC131151514 n=1 Tax=Malania oleifera TaxID=397392 RepID=UPI0025AEC520|nr:uncharacterized protein LOC131151514 [Malania oleifera]
MANPDFTEELDLSEAPPAGEDWVSYRNFIDRIRQQLRTRGQQPVHGLPVLPREERRPTGWFDVLLRTRRDYAVRFRMRIDNLYLVGFRVEQGPNPRWFEFNRQRWPRRLIAGSANLGFGDSYPALLHECAEDCAPNWRWENMRVGRQDLLNAVERLGTADQPSQRAQSLLPAILMINEAIRLNDIKHFFVRHHGESLSAPIQFLNLARLWGNLSERLLRTSPDDTSSFHFPPNDFGIQTFLQAVAAIAIIKYRIFFSTSHSHRRFPRSADTGYGQPLVEVFSVRINDDTGGEIHLYGFITATDGLTCQYMYNRRRVEPEQIYTGDTILLTGPARPISASDSFAINFDLMDENRVSPNDGVAFGQLLWNVFSTESIVFDEPLSETIDGRNGSMTLNYVAMSDAVQASIEITLTDIRDGRNLAEVYGKITASSDKFANKSSMLFWRTSDDDDIEGTRRGHLISLLRSAVAVPLGSSLIVTAELFNRDRETGSNHEIANGSKSFAASLWGTNTKVISGASGQIQVKVTWINM